MPGDRVRVSPASLGVTLVVTLFILIPLVTTASSVREISRPADSRETLTIMDNAGVLQEYSPALQGARVRRQTGNWWFDGSTFPHPRDHRDACRRPNVANNWICNPDKVIADEEADKLQTMIAETVSASPCQCGTCGANKGHFGIAIALPSYLLGPEMLAVNTIQNFTSNLAVQFWRDLAQCDDHVIIGLSASQRVFHTSVGKTAGNKVTAACIDAASNHVRPKVKQGHPFDALRDLVTIYSGALRDLGCVMPSEGLTSGQVAGIVIGTLVGVFLLVYVLVCVGYCFGADCVLGTALGPCARYGLVGLQGFINCCCVQLIGGLCKSCCERDCPGCVCRPVQCVWSEDEQQLHADNPTGIVGFDPQQYSNDAQA